MFRSKTAAILIMILASAVAALGQTHSERIDFPEVEGWEREAPSVYPQPELGYSVSYLSEDGGNVTVYVYNGGRSKIADGHDNKEVKNELRNARADVDKFVDLGYYEKAETVKSDVVTLGGKIKAAREVIALTVRGQKLTSEIYLLGHKNQFIKVRTTRRFESDGAINPAVRSLFEAIAKTLSDGSTVSSAGATEGAVN